MVGRINGAINVVHVFWNREVMSEIHFGASVISSISSSTITNSESTLSSEPELMSGL